MALILRLKTQHHAFSKLSEHFLFNMQRILRTIEFGHKNTLCRSI